MPKILTADFSPHNSFQKALKYFRGMDRFYQFAFFSFLLLILATPFIINSSFTTKQHAAVTQVVFVDANNTQIAQTTTPSVRVKLTSPWAVAMSQQKFLAENGYTEYLAVLGAATGNYQVRSAGDDVNEVNKKLENSTTSIWLGNGGTTTTSYSGIRFTNVSIPKGAIISSAQISVQPTSTQWIGMKFQISGDNVGNSAPFSAIALPSSRVLTSAKISHNSNVRWIGNTWYTFGELKSIIQEIVNRPDWQSNNSLSIVMRGTGGGSWGRKFVKSYESGVTTAPKLLVQYTSTGTIPTATPTVVNTPTVTSVPTATTAPVIKTASITLAEDPSFTVNVHTISPVTTNPTFFTYTFSTNGAGNKFLFAKFTSSTGQEQIFSNSIALVAVTPTPSPSMNMSPTPTLVPTTGGIWGVVDPSMLGNCTAVDHDKYVIDGKDGYSYRTWHPQVDSNGCIYAHEHGDDPDTMKDTWVRANWDPRFGYAARRMTSAAEPSGHVEGHDGYKVFSANVGLTNDEGRVNRTASLSIFHMGTGTPKRFTVQHHSNSIAYRYETGTPYAATHLMMDTGGVSDVCDPRSPAPTKDGITLQNRCKLGSPYEIWATFQTIKSGSKEIYRGFATPAVFDPITVFNKDNPTEVVYVWDPRVAAIKLFNDDWSGFRGCERENYAQIGYFYNEGGPTTYYTDPMGNVVPQGAPNAISQQISASNIVGLLSTQDNVAFKKKTSYCQQIGKLGLKN